MERLPLTWWKWGGAGCTVGRGPEGRWEMRTDKDEWKKLSEQYLPKCEHISQCCERKNKIIWCRIFESEEQSSLSIKFLRGFNV